MFYTHTGKPQGKMFCDFLGFAMMCETLHFLDMPDKINNDEFMMQTELQPANDKFSYLKQPEWSTQ